MDVLTHPANTESRTDTPFTKQELETYARVAIDYCLDLKGGDLLLIDYEPEHRPLVVALHEIAYGAGLRVSASLSDPLFLQAELEHASNATIGRVETWDRDRSLARTEEGAAQITLRGEEMPGVLDAFDPERAALRNRRTSELSAELYSRMRDHRDSFLILAYPTLAWASMVYPEMPQARAQRRLAEDLLDFCRIGRGDGAGALERHIASLRSRAEVADSLKLTELRFRGPGTDLKVGLSQDHAWRTAELTNAYGRTFFRNLPSEEIFTSPLASATEGYVRCTKPRAAGGIVCNDIQLEFRGGRLVRAEAATDAQRDTLLAQLDPDPGARRLGEVALVDGCSRVGHRKRIFWNTLLDENQTCHIAIGMGLADCRRRGSASPDLNHAATHVDLMIGGPEVEVTGRTATGETIPLIVDGVWRPS